MADNRRHRGRDRPAPELIVAIDTREQRPYAFAGARLATLATGDYSVVGFEDRVTVERKQVAELFTCTGRERARFVRELERMSGFDYPAIVVEGTLHELLDTPAFSSVSPKAVLNSLISWSVQFRLPVFFCGSRAYARAVTFRILEKYLKHRVPSRRGDALGRI